MAKLRRAETGMTLGEHLAELRQRLMVIFICVSVVAVLAFIFYTHLLVILQNPYCSASPGHCKFLVTNPLDGLNLRVKIAFFSGFVISSPVILWESWRFITPGLKARERRYAVPFVAASIIFFSAGMVLAYFSFAQAIQWLKDIGGSTLLTEYNPNQYLTLFLLMLFIFGIAFLFPVVLVALELINVVTPARLLHSWRYAVIAITVVAAIVTPSSDPLSMLALAAPLVAFYFLAILVGKMLHK
ncbi:MAG TPA: twin-arginine translocase subunit TatC [Acidimicrobiales bacterium]|nr:twin-arginine translocase subunit TatC [Acidimicrobiales bacterium]